MTGFAPPPALPSPASPASSSTVGAMASPALAWVRPPRQTRSQRTLVRILDATARLLETHTFDEVTIAAIVREAKSSVGAFYARFPDKQALLFALQDRFADEQLATAAAALDPAKWRDVSGPDLVRSSVAFLVEAYRGHAGLRRTFLLNAGLPEIRAKSESVNREVAALITSLLASRSHTFSHRDPVVAGRFIHRIIFSVLDNAILYRTEGAPDDVDDVLEEELTRASIGYLGFKG